LGADAFHVVVAVDVAGDNIRIVTACRPEAGEWLDDMKTRRKTQSFSPRMRAGFL
jgi:hypothetical protein